MDRAGEENKQAKNAYAHSKFILYFRHSDYQRRRLRTMKLLLLPHDVLVLCIEHISNADTAIVARSTCHSLRQLVDFHCCVALAKAEPVRPKLILRLFDHIWVGPTMRAIQNQNHVVNSVAWNKLWSISKEVAITARKDGQFVKRWEVLFHLARDVYGTLSQHVDEEKVRRVLCHIMPTHYLCDTSNYSLYGVFPKFPDYLLTLRANPALLADPVSKEAPTFQSLLKWKKRAGV